MADVQVAVPINRQLETVTAAQEIEVWALGIVRKSNAVALEALSVLTDVVQPVTSMIPSVTPPLAYDFAQQFMAGERKFAEDLLHLTERLTPPPAAKAA